MKLFELHCKTYLKRDISYETSFDVLSSYINFAFTNDEKLKEFHQNVDIKSYSFGNFYPIQKDKIYKLGNIYEFIIRSLDEEFIYKLQKYLRENINNSHIQVLQTSKKVVNQFFITELYSITPVITTIKDDEKKYHFWTTQKDGDILKLQKQLQDNLIKKYESFYKEKLNPTQNFIQLLELKNKTPQSIYINKNGKKIRFLGNKFKIIPNEDEISQKLAFVALACGLGEKQSYGGGFCLGKGMR